MRLSLRLLLSAAVAATLLAAGAAPVRAEYVVLRSGTRLNVTSYQLVDGKYRLQMKGGTVEIPADEVAYIEPEETFEPIPPPLTAKTPFYDFIHTASERYGVDADLIHCVIAVESNFNPKAISRKNARGLMQLLPQTAAHLGVHNIFDPHENIDAGTRYLKFLLARYNNNVNLALAAYNAGPLRVDQHGRRVPPYPETTKYIQHVARIYVKMKAEAAHRDNPTQAVTALPAGK